MSLPNQPESVGQEASKPVVYSVDLVLQQADVVNRNGRVYPERVLLQALTLPLGEITHPTDRGPETK